jgi:hypothetical protein
MRAASISEERLRRLYEVLRETLGEQEEPVEPEDSPWYAPVLPPLDLGSRISATDLLSWWFRPPNASRGSWDAYFGDEKPQTTVTSQPVVAAFPQPPADHSRTSSVSRAALRSLLPIEEEELSPDDADQAVEVFYEFLHAFARRDVKAALELVGENYHILENDVEVSRRDLANRLESLLASFSGWDLSVGLSIGP